MKCSVCYHDNPAWQKICTYCGQTAVALQLCPSGHLLKPEQTDCPVCPSMWPESGQFAGPAILRGVLWVDHGKLRTPDGRHHMPYVELRDSEQPLAFLIDGPGSAQLSTEDAAPVGVKVEIRPEATRYCLGPDYVVDPGLGLSYQDLAGEERFRVGPVTFRVLFFSIPSWVS